MGQNSQKPQKSMTPLRKAANMWRKFEAGKVLTLTEAILANCYMCNGGDSADCQAAEVCPLYPFGLFGRPQRSNQRRVGRKQGSGSSDGAKISPER